MYKLPKSMILRSGAEFQRVYKCGRSVANRHIVMYTAKNPRSGGKVGFAAGKKLGNASIRNRVKRLLRECYRLNRHRLKDGYDLLLVGRKSAVEYSYDTLEKAFIELAKRSGICLD